MFSISLGTYNRLRLGQTTINAYSKIWRENKEYYQAKINDMFEEGLFERLFFYLINDVMDIWTLLNSFTDAYLSQKAYCPYEKEEIRKP